MKNPLEITLTSLHLGSARRVVTLKLCGRDLAAEFLEGLALSNRKGFEQIRSRIKAVAERDKYENKVAFRSVGDGIYEFKCSGLRLYAFYEDGIPELGPKLIIAAYGGSKNTKKEQKADIAHAKKLRSQYLEIKAEPNAQIQLLKSS